MSLRKGALVILLFSVAFALVTIVPVGAQAKRDDGEFLRRVAQANHIPLERLEIADRFSQDYPDTGRRLDTAKVIDTTTGEAYLLALDDQGNSIDLATTEAAEAKAKVSKFGKIDPSLLDKLNKSGSAALPVSIWLNVPDTPLRRQDSAPLAPDAAPAAAMQAAQTVQEHLMADLDQVSQFMAPQRQGVVDDLTRLGAQPLVPMYAPAVFATLNRAQINAIAQRADVSFIYGPDENTHNNDDSGTTEEAFPVWMSGNLGFGMTSRPVIHEDDGVASFNPYLNNASHPVILWCAAINSFGCNLGANVTSAGNPSGHATEVAGVIASTHPLHRGIAPAAQLILSANSQDLNNDAKNVAAFEWARLNGGNPINMSWGQICPNGQQNFMSRYIDWATRNLGALSVISSGNQHPACPAVMLVSAPGLAWTALTVGAIDDHNNGFWAGDNMAAFSRWGNPAFAPGMEKPEVVAVGVNRRTTDALFGDNLTPAGVNGTSFSAPAVTGQATLMYARQPGQVGWPETTKAAVLASAFHDIEAGRSRDGVGAVMDNISDDTYRLGRFRNASFNFAANPDLNYLDAISLVAGQRARVAIAWDSRSSGGAGPDTLGADVDLRVRAPNNVTIVGSSASVQNAWELVDFIAPTTGLYDILIHKFSNEAGYSSTFLGTAWSTLSQPSICTGAVNVPLAGGTFNGISTANGPTFYDTYAGWPTDQSGRERVFRLTLNTTRDITFSDTNPNLDLHIVRLSSCSGTSTITTVLANGANSAVLDNAPAGTYFLIVDGLNGAVGTTNVTVSVTGP
jgi:serine protease AprX